MEKLCSITRILEGSAGYEKRAREIELESERTQALADALVESGKPLCEIEFILGIRDDNPHS